MPIPCFFKKKYNKMTNYEKDRIGVEKNDYVITRFFRHY